MVINREKNMVILLGTTYTIVSEGLGYLSEYGKDVYLFQNTQCDRVTFNDINDACNLWHVLKNKEEFDFAELKVIQIDKTALSFDTQL